MRTLPWGFGPRWFRKWRQRRALDAMGEAVRKGLETTFPELRKPQKPSYTDTFFDPTLIRDDRRRR